MPKYLLLNTQICRIRWILYQFIIDLRKLLLKLKDKDEINIILHIIDTKSNLYIAQKYKNINSKLKEKDKWLYYDDD